MTLTRKMIDSLRFPWRMDIDNELEAQLLKRFRNEPYPNEYSEQDLFEQVRKYVMSYNQAKGTVPQTF